MTKADSDYPTAGLSRGGARSVLALLRELELAQPHDACAVPPAAPRVGGPRFDPGARELRIQPA